MIASTDEDIDKVLVEVKEKMRRTKYGNIKIVMSETSSFIDIVTEERLRINKPKLNGDSVKQNSNLRKG